MDRLACIDVAALPLQLLLRRHPEWRERPVVVVEADKPQARILWTNERARALAIERGHRYAAGLSLARDLCAGVVPPTEIAAGITAIAKRLRTLSPHVETAPADGDPGVFWARAKGLEKIHATERAWGRAVLEALAADRFAARAAIGHTRFGTYALVRAQEAPLTIARTAAAERDRAAAVPLARLRFAPAARDALEALGVRTLADLVRLPAAGLATRYGAEVLALHRAAQNDRQAPLQPEYDADPVRRHTLLDHAETDAHRLLFAIKRLLDPLLEALVDRREAAAALRLELRFDDGEARTERLCPADPCVDARLLLDLVRLRLERVRLRRGVTELALDAEPATATTQQLQLFERRRRDPAAAARALARLRAEFGDDAVVHARAPDKHVPDAAAQWTPLPRPRPRPPHPRVAPRRLVRRIYTRPLALPPRPRHEEDGWQLRGRDDAPVVELRGPYVLSGGWWRRDVHREYHFARTRRDEWLWVFYDLHRRRWFLQGRLE